MEIREQEAERNLPPVKQHEERIRQWRKTPGDLDDFIFHLEHSKEASER